MTNYISGGFVNLGQKIGGSKYEIGVAMSLVDANLLLNGPGNPQHLRWLYGNIENVNGSSSADLIVDSDADNYLVGNDGDDIFYNLGAGNDTINGGAGADMAVYQYNRGDYEIYKSGTQITIQSKNQRDFGVDRLINIEYVEFNDQKRVAVSQIQDRVFQTAPTLTTVNPLPGTTEDTPYTITWAALAAAADEADAQGDAIAFRVESITSGTLTKNGQQVVAGTTRLAQGEQWVWTPPANANGTLGAFKVRAVDAALASSSDVQVNIPVVAVNDAPVVANPVPDASVAVGSSLNFTVASNAFTDIDSAALTYSATRANGSALPAWLSFNAATRTFSGTPAAGDAGAVAIKVTASDGALSASDEFTLTVGGAPRAASFSPADGARAVPVGSNLVLTFSAPVQLGAGPIVLKTAAGQVVETFSAAHATVSGSTLTLDPKADLGIFTTYVVELGAGAVKDLSGNGNAADSSYDFRTATLDSLYHFFVVAFGAAPGLTYMGQLAEAWNYFSAQPARADGMPVLQQIVEIFTTKKQFTDVYPETLSNREFATQLVGNVLKGSASAATKQQAIDNVDAALSQAQWSRGKMLYTVFGNLADKPVTDAVWGATAQQFQKQLVVAKYLTEEMGVATENLAVLRGVLAGITADTDVSTTQKIVQIIGTLPPG